MTLHPWKSLLGQRWLRQTILVVGVACSLAGAYMVKQVIDREARASFRALAVDQVHEIELRLRAYVDVLYALRGAFDSSQTLTRDEFHKLRIGELVEATLKHSSLEHLRVRIFTVAGVDPDGNGLIDESLLYDSALAPGAPDDADYGAYVVNEGLAVGDREWRFEITPVADPVTWFGLAVVGGVLVASLGLVALLYGLLRTLAKVQLRQIELSRLNREMALLTVFGEELHSSGSLKDAYDVAIQEMPALFPGTAAVLYVLDASRKQATAAARWCSPAAVADKFAAENCQALSRGHAHCGEEAGRAPRCGHFTGAPPSRYLCLPLIAQGGALGVLHVQPQVDSQHGSPCDETMLNLLKTAAQHLALALANLGLREDLLERATRDSLTRLYNRYYVREWFQRELQLAGRHARSLGVIMLDIDRFKRVNDEFGHAAGDLVLREVAAVLRRLARRSDVACRHGGEEFLLLMPKATLEGTVAKAEQLRREIALLDLSCERQALGRITVSAGVAMYPAHGQTAATLLHRADEALYAAKERGRNRVVVAAPGTGAVSEPAQDLNLKPGSVARAGARNNRRLSRGAA